MTFLFYTITKHFHLIKSIKQQHITVLLTSSFRHSQSFFSIRQELLNLCFPLNRAQGHASPGQMSWSSVRLPAKGMHKDLFQCTLIVIKK